jgi:predicted aconitase
VTPRLSQSDRRTLDGGAGEGARMAMSIVVRMAEVYGPRS